MFSLPAILLAAIILCATPLTALAAAADVVFASANARLIAVDLSEQPLKKGMSVANGETVDTADGIVQLRFRDGGTISLRPGTRFKVEQFRFSGKEGKAAGDDRMTTRLIKGTLRALSGLIGKERHEQYQMKTSVGTIGIRGTEFGATFDDLGLRVTTHAGLVEVCSEVACERIGPGQSLILRDAASRPTRLIDGSTPRPGQENSPPVLPQPQSLPSLPQQPMPDGQKPAFNQSTTSPATASPSGN